MTVKNQIVSNYEKLEWIDVDGNRYNLHNPYKSAILSISGWGMLTPEIATTRSPYQHGETPISIQYNPRRITLTWFYKGCSRNDYWTGRDNIIDALRVNKTNLLNPMPGTLKWFRSDGSIRAVDCFLVKGPDFPQGSGEWASFYPTDQMDFIAYFPPLYDPNQLTLTFDDLECIPAGELVFPITFTGTTDIIFGENTCENTDTLNLDFTDATFEEYPIIEIDGPVDNFRITNAANGLKLELEYSIPLGTTVTIVTRPDIFTIEDDAGNDLFYTLTGDSHPGYWRLEDGEINALTVYTEASTIASEVRILYYLRYVG